MPRSTQPGAVSIDVERAVPQERDQRNSGLLCQLDREARWRADRREQRYAGRARFLHELESSTIEFAIGSASATSRAPTSLSMAL